MPRLIRAVLVTATFALLSIGIATPSSASTRGVAGAGDVTAQAAIVADVGGLNLNAYCRSRGVAPAFRTNASQTGWVCADNQPINMTLACEFQFAPAVNRGLVVGAFNNNNLDRWGCQVAVNVQPDRLGGMNLAGYCFGTGHGNGAFNEGHSVDGWFCSDRTRIDLTAACQFQYSLNTLTHAVVATFRDSTDAFRIGCLGLR
jgi:hypothetical protein